jgi:two-component system phosphate regulon sensor histidine kinase PhoR
VNVSAPTTVVLYRARLIFTLTALIPTMLMAGLGIILVAEGGSKSVALVGGILVLAFCGTALAGWALGTMFVMRGASLAGLQNEFLSSVSHELRTPLTSIRLFIDTLREGRVSDRADQERCLTVIDQELVRLDDLVGKLIDLSKIESRRQSHEWKTVAIADVVSDAVGTLKTMDLSTETPVDIRVEQGLLVTGDHAALVQAVGNLLSNAWKYTRPETRHIQLRATGDAKNVHISVTDNGLGIAATEQSVIFEKFQRGSAARARSAPGSGLGLALVRAIVTTHGGHVALSSQLDYGSTFRITLPRVVDAA